MNSYIFEKQQLLECLKMQGCRDDKVLQAIADIPREDFITDYKSMAYENRALPIGHKQTISQPYIVCIMSQLLISKRPINRVLEIGTGSGYQAAILSKLAKEVFTIERIKVLYEQARKNLENYKNVHCFYGDGYKGLPEFEPFDGILITAAVKEFPSELLKQMAENCVAVYPEGEDDDQQLVLIDKSDQTVKRERHDTVIFVPMLQGTSQFN